jgi:hypothetical protein
MSFMRVQSWLNTHTHRVKTYETRLWGKKGARTICAFANAPEDIPVIFRGLRSALPGQTSIGMIYLQSRDGEKFQPTKHGGVSPYSPMPRDTPSRPSMR